VVPFLAGVNSLAVGHPVAEVERLAAEVLASVGFRGIGSVEFKRSSRDGRLYIVEPTVGRVNLQSGIATAAGVNIPFIALCDALGLPLPESGAVRTDQRWLDERSDLDSARYYVQRGSLTRMAWLRSLRGPRTHLYFSLTDPLPFCCLAIGLAARVVGYRSSWW